MNPLANTPRPPITFGPPSKRRQILELLDRPFVRSAAILIGLLAIAMAIGSTRRQRYVIEGFWVLDTVSGETFSISNNPHNRHRP